MGGRPFCSGTIPARHPRLRRLATLVRSTKKSSNPLPSQSTRSILQRALRSGRPALILEGRTRGTAPWAASHTPHSAALRRSSSWAQSLGVRVVLTNAHAELEDRLGLRDAGFRRIPEETGAFPRHSPARDQETEIETAVSVAIHRQGQSPGAEATVDAEDRMVVQPPSQALGRRLRKNSGHEHSPDQVPSNPVALRHDSGKTPPAGMICGPPFGLRASNDATWPPRRSRIRDKG